MTGLAAMRAARAGQAWQEATDRTLQSIDDTQEMMEAYFFLAGAGFDEVSVLHACGFRPAGQPRPMSAAERTRSSRWRAGSRRTKRQARRRG